MSRNFCGEFNCNDMNYQNFKKKYHVLSKYFGQKNHDQHSDCIATSFRHEFERNMNKLSFFRSHDANFNLDLSFKDTFVTKRT